MNKKVFFRYLAMATLFLMVAIVSSSCKKEIKMCMVTFMCDDNVVFQFQVVENSKLSEPEVYPNYHDYYGENYIFGGWFTDKQFTTNPWNFANDIVTSDLTLYAKWIDNTTKFTVTFISDGNVYDEISVVYGSKLPDSYMHITKEGCTLSGWYYYYYDDYYSFWEFANDVVTKDITLYAMWGGIWTKKADFRGTARTSAVGFSIGNKGYIGTGHDGSYSLQDFWEYDPISDSWTRKENFRGTARTSAVGFSIGNKGYIGTGYGDNGSLKKDFWEYDPISDSWTQKANFSANRYGAVGFSIGNKGYIGTGEDSSYEKDFWEYDPVSNTWTQKANFRGAARWGAVGFSIGNKGYIGTGFGDPYCYQDFWEYDPISNSWTQKANFKGGDRVWAVGFSIGNKGYIGTGIDNNSFWEYDPVSNSWTQKVTGMGGNSAVGFSIGNKGYIGTGWGNDNNFWEFTP